MSLDAIIHKVEYPGDGSAILRMKNGERALTVTNPPLGCLLDVLAGEHIRIAGNHVFLAGIVWAKRLGHVRIEILPKRIARDEREIVAGMERKS